MKMSFGRQTGAVLGGLIKINVRSILEEVYFGIHKYTYSGYVRTLSEYVL